jgi:CheY-like chemotaxis protein
MIEKAYIIDDDEVSLFLTSMLLESGSYVRHVESFSNAAQALTKLQQEEEQLLPEVIFLDLNMPDICGWEFLDILTKQEQRYLNKSSVYILSSSVDNSEKEKAKEYKLVTAFLHKPLEEEELDRYFTH